MHVRRKTYSPSFFDPLFRDGCRSVTWGELKNGDSVASAGWLTILIQLQNQLVFSNKAMDFASDNGHLDVVKWLHYNRTEGCTRKAMDYAENGHVDVVKWFLYNRTEGGTTDTMDWTAKRGITAVKKTEFSSMFVCFHFGSIKRNLSRT